MLKKIALLALGASLMAQDNPVVIYVHDQPHSNVFTKALIIGAVCTGGYCVWKYVTAKESQLVRHGKENAVLVRSIKSLMRKINTTVRGIGNELTKATESANDLSSDLAEAQKGIQESLDQGSKECSDEITQLVEIVINAALQQNDVAIQREVYLNQLYRSLASHINAQRKYKEWSSLQQGLIQPPYAPLNRPFCNPHGMQKTTN